MKLRLVLFTAAVLLTAAIQHPATPPPSDARVALTQGPASSEPARHPRARQPMAHVEAVPPAVVLR